MDMVWTGINILISFRLPQSLLVIRPGEIYPMWLHIFNLSIFNLLINLDYGLLSLRAGYCLCIAYQLIHW